MLTHAVMFTEVYNGTRARPVFFAEGSALYRRSCSAWDYWKVGDVRLLRVITERDGSIIQSVLLNLQGNICTSSPWSVHTWDSTLVIHFYSRCHRIINSMFAAHDAVIATAHAI